MLHHYFLLDKLASSLPPAMRYEYLAVLGGVIGMSIGFFPSFVEGKGNYSFRGAIRAGVTGAFLGGLSGIITLPIAEWLHSFLGGGMKGRVTSWTLFGSVVGAAVGIAEGRIGGARPWRGVLGGVVGGALAGAVLELLLSHPVQGVEGSLNVQAVRSLSDSAIPNNSAIVALLLLGLCIAFFIAVFVNVLSDAWLEGQPGSKVQGQIYHLGKFRDPLQAVLGSDKTKMVFIHIPDAEPTHAGITLTRRGAFLRHLAQGGVTRINDQVVKEHMLREGEIIAIGSARLRYRERRRTTAAPLSTGSGQKRPA
ncbi:MAG: hypothetical protein ACJ74W_24060 [Pyrinomonadaceae bacterium]